MQYVGVGFLAVQVAQQCLPFSFTSRLCSNLISSSADQVAGCGSGELENSIRIFAKNGPFARKMLFEEKDVQFKDFVG